MNEKRENESIISWIKKNVPTSFQNDNVFTVFQMIDQYVFENIESLLLQFKNLYNLSYFLKFFFEVDQIHIVIRWIYKDLLLKEKIIGESIFPISLSTFDFDFDGNLLIDIKDTYFISSQLLDFKIIVTDLTLKINILLRNTINKSKNSDILFKNNNKEEMPLPFMPPSKIQKQENFTQNKNESPLPLPSSSNSKTSNSKKQKFVIPQILRQAIHNINENENENENNHSDENKNKNNNEINDTIELDTVLNKNDNDNNNINKIQTDNQEQKKEVSSNSVDDTTFFVPNKPEEKKKVKIPPIPKIQIKSIKGE